MFQKPRVIFKFSKDGEVKIDVEGASGPGCLKLTESVRDRLQGCVVEEKTEIHETNLDVTLTQEMGHGG